MQNPENEAVKQECEQKNEAWQNNGATENADPSFSCDASDSCPEDDVPVNALLLRDNPLLQDTVQFKLGLISPVIHGTYPTRSAKAYFQLVADKEYHLPDGSVQTFSVSTLERWVRDFRVKGIDALIPKERADQGYFRKLNLETQVQIAEMLRQYPEITATKVLSRLQEKHNLPDGAVSEDTIRRFIAAHQLRQQEADKEVDRIRHFFLEPETGNLWAADTMYLCKITVGNRLKWVYVQGILDNHTRLVVVARCTLHDNALSFQDALYEAVRNYNIPTKLYVDNGSPYIDTNLKRICSTLGIALIHTRSRDGASKGCVERSWLSLDQDVSADIILDHLETLEDIQACVDRWVDKYNNRINKGVGGIPRQRYEASLLRHPVRHPESEAALKDAFLHTETRTVRCGAIQQNSRFYELPEELRKPSDPKKIQIFFNPHDVPGTIFTLGKNNKRVHLHELDKEANAGKKRNTGGRTEELREKARQRMTISEEHAEKRYQRRQEAIQQANRQSETYEKHLAHASLPESLVEHAESSSPAAFPETQESEEILHLDYNTL